ncbi:MAG: efflux RND transporter periplasmic adaptor subunit [Candidatus Marinimicrobia bacterium]|nr:efflux RND transporter periplasmic adaptor subunit [Candidatus Neomarinimicrobiota bacterium]
MKKIIATTLIFLIAASLFYYFYQREPASPGNSAVSQNAGEPPPSSSVPVTAVMAENDELTQYITTTGRMESRRSVDLTAQVAGYIRSLPVQNGDAVAEEAVLAAIADDPFRLALEQHRSTFFKALGEAIQELHANQTANVDLLQSYFQRAFQMPLLDALPGIASPGSEREPVIAGAAGSESASPLTRAEYMILARHDIPGLYVNVKEAERQLQQCRVHAPFAGTISDVSVSEGAYVSQGTKLCVLTNLDRLQVAIDVLEADLPYIDRGTEFTIIDEGAAPLYQGVITGVSPSVDEATRTGTAYARIANGTPRFRHGQFVRIRLEKQTFTDRLIIPRDAVLVRNDRDLVFVVEDGLAKWRYIQQGVANDRFVEVVDGVAAGDTVIAGGHYSLAHDARVDVRMESNSQVNVDQLE